MRVALYARYSAGPRQTDQSIEGQIRECTEFCKRKGFTIVETYADRHISGKTDERPEFQRLIADSRRNKFEGVVVYKTDRFARNKYDSAIYKRQLKQNGVQIYYAAEAIPDGPEGIILESLMEGLAEYYSAELAQKIRRGMHDSARKGKVLGNSIPLGYRRSKEHTYEIDPEGAKAVEMIFDMYIDQFPNADICNKLNDLGFRTSRGNLFNKNSITRIVQNEMYIGTYSAAGVTIEHGVPALISEERFALAQKERERRRGSKKERKASADYLLSGKLFCGYCKKSMTGVSGTGKSGRKFYYYYCQTVRKKGDCHKEKVAKDFIEDIIAKETADRILQPEVLDDLIDKLWDLQSEADTTPADIAFYKKKLQDNKKATENILKAIESGLAADTLLTRLAQLESEKSAILGEIAFLETRTFGFDKTRLRFYLESLLKENETNDWEERKRFIITYLVSEVYLYDDHFLIRYNLENIGQEPCACVTLPGAEVFDQSFVKSTYLVASRTPEATIYVTVSGIIMKCQFRFKA